MSKPPSRSASAAAGSSAAGARTQKQDIGSAQTADLPDVRRDFYLEHPRVAALTPAQAQAVRATLDIQIHGDVDECPNPVDSFLEASFPQYILDALATASFTTPTAIQRQAWPVAMRGLDLIGLAATGSGKTLAYLLPALVHANAQPVSQPGDGPLVLVLAPTRELAVQIHEECVRFGHPCGVRTACIFGGVPKGPQLAMLRNAPEIVVATPGRLIDLLSAKRTELSHCTFLIVDEADRMLDLGFEPQIRQLLLQARADRQTLLFSATWPRDVQALAHTVLLPGVLTVEVGGALTRGGKANTDIRQRVFVCEEASKMDTLVGLLEEELAVDGARLLVFASSKRRADELTRSLRLDGWPALAMHGDKAQEEREWVLHEFKEGHSPLLVATDVAQRGLDIKGVSCVINFDCPSSGEAYVHRIGRTGRAGETGTACTLVTTDDARVAAELVRVLKSAAQPVPDALEGIANTWRRHGYSH